MGIVLGVLLTILGAQRRGHGVLIWDDEDEKSSDSEPESESESKDQREGFKEEAASSMETGIDGLEEMEDGSEGPILTLSQWMWEIVNWLLCPSRLL